LGQLLLQLAWLFMHGRQGGLDLKQRRVPSWLARLLETTMLKNECPCNQRNTIISVAENVCLMRMPSKHCTSDFADKKVKST
jgi:hypothetical protein